MRQWLSPTGTANKVDPLTGQYSTSNYVASFMGFVPASAPKLLVAVMVDQPQGAIYGGCSPLVDVPLLIGLYQAGKLKLDELITRRYTLDEINEGYQDMLDGKNIRGVIIHEH